MAGGVVESSECMGLRLCQCARLALLRSVFSFGAPRYRLAPPTGFGSPGHGVAKLPQLGPIHRRRLVVSSIVRVLVAPRQLHPSFGLVSAWSLPLSRWRPARAAVPRSYVGVPQLGRGAPWHSGHLAGLLHSGADFTWRPASGQLCSQSVRQAGGRQAGGGRRRQEEAGGGRRQEAWLRTSACT